MNRYHAVRRCFNAPLIRNSWQTRSISVLRPTISDETSAKNFVNGLSISEQEHLAEALSHVIDQNNGNGELTRKLLAQEAVFAGIPFLGFGFLDNSIMLCAGEYIDITLGSALGISTLAAAGMGNLLSDVAGIGTAGTVEQNVKRILGRSTVLTPKQRDTSRAHRWVFAGRCISICLGCILGMWPLLLLSSKDEEKSTDSH